MNGFQLRLRGRGRSRQPRKSGRPIQSTKNDDAKKKTPFQTGSESDSDEDGNKPVKRKLSHIVVEGSSSSQKRPRGTEQPSIQATSSKEEESTIKKEKSSQIARLVARRKEAHNFMGATSDDKDVKETALFKFDVESCVNESSVDAYRKVPIDGFGEMMLRSMGWKGSVSKGEKKNSMATSEWTPRLQRLGLGAKPEDALRVKKKSRVDVKGENSVASAEADSTSKPSHVSSEKQTRNDDNIPHASSESVKSDGIHTDSTRKKSRFHHDR